MPKIERIFDFGTKVNRTNEEGTCLWCGRKLRTSDMARLEEHRGRKGGYADNAFCGLRCGYLFGVTMAELGYKLKPRSEGDNERKD